MDIKYIQSPNFSHRLDNAIIDMIVMHHTNMPTLHSAIARLCDRATEVSAHYVISKEGQIYQLVREEFKAWHAGLSCWRRRNALNNYSIGIELENTGKEIYPIIQISSLITLIQDIMKRNSIDARNIVGHFDIAPSRKDDPNHHFPWQELNRKEIGIYPEIQTPPLKGLFSLGDASPKILGIKTKLFEYGYDIKKNEKYDEHTQKVIIAFKRHFCPESFHIEGWDTISNVKLNKLIELINVK